MQRRRPFSRPAVAVVLLGAIAVSTQGRTQAAGHESRAIGAEAVASCERAARQTLTARVAMTSPPIEVSFDVAPTLHAGLSNDDQVELRGAGRARGAGGVRSFGYSCRVDLQTSRAIGLVVRDTTVSAKAMEPVRTTWDEPDLSHLSPADCETSATEALQRRWPRIAQVIFETSSRSFSQQSSSVAELHGSGRALPAPGGPIRLFVFDCQLDPRTGRVLRTNISG